MSEPEPRRSEGAILADIDARQREITVTIKMMQESRFDHNTWSSAMNPRWARLADLHAELAACLTRNQPIKAGDVVQCVQEGEYGPWLRFGEIEKVETGMAILANSGRLEWLPLKGMTRIGVAVRAEDGTPEPTFKPDGTIRRPS